jgi:hypothetical protein
MSKPPLLQIDDLDSRREVWHLLSRLPPQKRLLYLSWACAQVPQGRGKLPPPVPGMMRVSVDEARRDDKADAKHTNEIYCDLLSLMRDPYNVDAMKLACELERRVTAHYRR